MLIVVRHGERADSAPDNSQQITFTFDPQLTSKGKEQASKVGQLITNQIPLGKLRVISSPYLRCIQTASHIIDGLGLTDTSPQIELLNGFGEWLKQEWFEKDVNPDLHSAQSQVAQEQLQQTQYQQYLKRCSKGGEEKVGQQPTYPESFEQYYSRIVSNLNNSIVPEIEKSSQDSQPLTIILVIHGTITIIRQLGFGIQCALELFAEYDFLKPIDYCNYSVFKHQDGKFHPVIIQQNLDE